MSFFLFGKPGGFRLVKKAPPRKSLARHDTDAWGSRRDESTGSHGTSKARHIYRSMDSVDVYGFCVGTINRSFHGSIMENDK